MDTDADSDFVDADPIDRFRRWLPAMYADSAVPPTMTLSTVDLTGFPEGRTVLLSEFDKHGFCFHTDSRSNKAVQLALLPRAALTLVWPESSRQVVIQGTVSAVASNDAAYRARSPYLQMLAWLNDTDMAQLPRSDRRAAWHRAVVEQSELVAPDTWAGFRLVPHRMVFWQGSPDATSQRVEYCRAGEGWRTALLPG